MYFVRNAQTVTAPRQRSGESLDLRPGQFSIDGMNGVGSIFSKVKAIVSGGKKKGGGGSSHPDRWVPPEVSSLPYGTANNEDAYVWPGGKPGNVSPEGIPYGTKMADINLSAYTPGTTSYDQYAALATAPAAPIVPPIDASGAPLPPTGYVPPPVGYAASTYYPPAGTTPPIIAPAPAPIDASMVVPAEPAPVAPASSTGIFSVFSNIPTPALVAGAVVLTAAAAYFMKRR